MKIQRVDTSGNPVQGAGGAERASAVGDLSKTFERHMSDLSGEAQMKKFAELTSMIEEQGQRLSKKSDMAEFTKYRRLITELLDEISSGSFEFKKSSTFDSRGRHRIYSIVRKVNTTLDELAAEVLKGQEDNINVLDKIDDIRGLLVDIFM